MKTLILLFLFTISISAQSWWFLRDDTQAPSTPDITTGLVALWQDGDTVDVTGRGNDLSAYGGFSVTASTLAGFDSAWTFDGIDGYLSRAGTNDLSLFQSDFSISFWGYFASDHNSGSIIDKGQASNDYDYVINALLSDGIVILSPSFASMSPSCSTAVWKYFTITDDGDSVRCYINGSLSNSAESNEVNNNGYSFNIGKWNADGWEYFSKCSIAQLAIYKRALTQEQISYLYNGGDGRLLQP